MRKCLQSDSAISLIKVFLLYPQIKSNMTPVKFRLHGKRKQNERAALAKVYIFSLAYKRRQYALSLPGQEKRKKEKMYN